MSNEPVKLYKYKSTTGDGFKFSEDIFVQNRLYLTDCSKLNDPAEGSFRIGKKIVTVPGETYGFAEESNIQYPTQPAKICSFSENELATLMWSHYANEHHGICIGFDFKKLKQSCLLHRVKYPSRVPLIDSKIPGQKEFEFALKHKQSAWSYENEWRIISFSSSDFISLEPNTISSVTYGCRVNENDMALINSWINSNNPKIIQYRTTIFGHAGKLHKKKI